MRLRQDTDSVQNIYVEQRSEQKHAKCMSSHKNILKEVKFHISEVIP